MILIDEEDFLKLSGAIVHLNEVFASVLPKISIDGWVTQEEALEVIGKNERQLRYLVEKGTIRAQLAGEKRKKRYNLGDLKKYAAGMVCNKSKQEEKGNVVLGSCAGL